MKVDDHAPIIFFVFMAGELTDRVLHNCKESADWGSRCDGEADDCLQGTRQQLIQGAGPCEYPRVLATRFLKLLLVPYSKNFTTRPGSE